MKITKVEVVQFILIFLVLLCGYVALHRANAASTDLPVRVGIWNLDYEPISSLALSECARHGFPCVVQCRDAPISDVVNACIKYELCCARAGPHLDAPFDSGGYGE